MNECVQSEEPGAPERLLSCSGWGDPELSFWQCPAVGVAGYHSEGFGQEGEWLCQWCGARPFWPLHSCDEPVDPGWWSHWTHLCEEVADETPEVHCWLGTYHWVPPRVQREALP